MVRVTIGVTLKVMFRVAVRDAGLELRLQLWDGLRLLRAEGTLPHEGQIIHQVRALGH